MRMLRVLVVGMGVLILLGLAVVTVTIVRRLSGPAARPMMAAIALAEPDGTRIAGMTPFGDRLALWLTGGGAADRVVLVETRAGGTLTTRITLAPATPLP